MRVVRTINTDRSETFLSFPIIIIVSNTKIQYDFFHHELVIIYVQKLNTFELSYRIVVIYNIILILSLFCIHQS